MKNRRSSRKFRKSPLSKKVVTMNRSGVRDTRVPRPDKHPFKSFAHKMKKKQISSIKKDADNQAAREELRETKRE